MSPGEAAIREANHAHANPPPVATPLPVAALHMIAFELRRSGLRRPLRDALSAFCCSVRSRVLDFSQLGVGNGFRCDGYAPVVRGPARLDRRGSGGGARRLGTSAASRGPGGGRARAASERAPQRTLAVGL